MPHGRLNLLKSCPSELDVQNQTVLLMLCRQSTRRTTLKAAMST